MTETTPENLGDVVNEQLPRIIKVRPGSSSERELTAVLPDELRDATVEKVLDYIRRDPNLGRKEERIVGRIKQEMNNEYGVTVGGNPVPKTATIGQHFHRDVSPRGTPYEVAELIVASNESGGAFRPYLRSMAAFEDFRSYRRSA